jgi:tetratricopeptide (TPR) repeat protein
MAKRSQRKKVTAREVSTPAAAVDVASRLPSRFNRDWLWGLILVLAVILAYQPVWRAGFIWDDDVVVTANPCITDPLGLKAIWTTSAADICPLTLTTFWMEYALWGLAPLPYHLVNVFMHAVCAVLFWRVLRGLQIPGAWLGAALWALHPVQVESVAWISEMKNTQSCLFYLLTILFFVRWLRTRENPKWGGWNYALTLLCAVLAMASKSSTVVLPVVLVLCAWWVKGQWQWRNVARVGPVFLMSIAAGVLSIWTQKPPATASQWIRPWSERLVTAGDAVWFYLGKLLWPQPLIAIYPRWKIDGGQWFAYLPLVAAIVVLIILWFKRQSWSRPYLLAWAYFLVVLLPILGLVTMSYSQYSFVADHFQYLAGMGPLALVGAGMVRLADFVIPRKPWWQSTLCVGLLLILGILSWHRASAFESNKTLWTDALAKNPGSWAVHSNVGFVLTAKGEVDAAIEQFHEALEIDPDSWMAWNNLGTNLAKKGQLDEAMADYRKALDIEPDYVEAHNNLGAALDQKGRIDEAIAQYERALEINPNFTQAYNNLGNARLQQERLDEAIVQYQKAIAIDPANWVAHSNLGWVFVQKEDWDDAIAQFQLVVEITPKEAKPRYDLANALAHQGRTEEAIAQFQKSLELDSSHAEVYYNFGIALMCNGRVDDAIVQYRKALEMNPNFAGAGNDLGIALAQKGQMAEAIAQFQEVLRRNPGDATAQRNLTRAQAAARTAPGSK